MTYELAKKLKDIGFPQEQRRGDLRCECDGDWDKHQKHKDNPPEAYAPSLSELIEACGEEFREVKQHSDYWTASSKKYLTGIMRYGSTPEEAVARLWIRLKGRNLKLTKN